MFIAILGCAQDSPPFAKRSKEDFQKDIQYSYGVAAFKDDAVSNAALGKGSLDLAFVDSRGKPVDLQAFRGKKNVVLVVTRGYPGYICPLCSGQTSRMIKQYGEFRKREAEVLVVFPGPSQHVGKFIETAQGDADNAKVPFPIVLDEDFKTVDRFGIRGDLAKPSTYILDKKGQVRFAYVGNAASDRPSVKSMLSQLDAIANE
jgi:peroxiredoxin